MEGKSDSLPPPATLMHLVAGKFVTQALAAAAELNVPEQLVDGPRTAQEIAGAMGVHAPSLHRLMRALAAVGVLTQRSDDELDGGGRRRRHPGVRLLARRHKIVDVGGGYGLFLSKILRANPHTSVASSTCRTSLRERGGC